MEFITALDNFRKFFSCAIRDRNFGYCSFFLLNCMIITAIISNTSSQSFSLYGQSVSINSSQTTDQPQKQCSSVGIQNLTTSGSQSQFPASNLLDNNLKTRWSNSDADSWIQLDLGASKNICSIGIAWHNGNERQDKFVISASNNGINFSEIFNGSSSGSTLSSEKYNVSDTNARYLRITVNGNTQSNYTSITEISVNVVSSSPKYSIGAAGDWGSARNDNWKKTVQLMKDNKVDLALGLGDYAYGSIKKFQPVVDELKEAGIPMKGAKGDHDSSHYAKLFEQPSMVYAFDAGAARVIILNSGKSPSSNAEYLERELNATSQPWKIVVTTTPLYTSPSDHDADKDQRRALQPLLDKYGVDLVMWGDNHNYERIKFPDSPTVFIQSGTGGESHYNFKRQIPESVYQNDKSFGITKLTLDNSTLSGEFISHSGKILDNFNIHK